MKEQTGVIIKILDENIVRVRLSSHGDCDNCGACPGAGAIELDILNPIGAKLGDKVNFYVQEQKMYKAAFILHVLPYLIIISLIVLGHYIDKSTSLYEIVFGVIGLIIAAVIIKNYDNKSVNKVDSRITEIL